MTNWAKTFYARQYAWMDGPGFWNIQPMHRETADAVQQVTAPPARVLELGAGGAQVSAALADLGYEVVAVELLPEVAARAETLASMPRTGGLTVLGGDFYKIELPGSFDLVCYWDGFGIGDDADQRTLLRRIRSWLAPEGQALIEIFTPWYWAGAAGRSMTLGAAARRYGFDGRGSRMLDTWWGVDEPGQAVTQSLRCYGPADLELLLEGTGLGLTRIIPGGCYHAEEGRYEAQAPLERAMSYLAMLAPSP